MKALITGATSGIGEALTSLLSKKGYSLILTGRSADKLLEIKEKLKAEIFSLDLTQKKDIDSLCQIIADQAPDLVINNAGFGVYGPVEEIESDEQVEMIRLNIEALTCLTIAATKALLAADKKGTILNVSSSAAFQPMPYFATYAATKSFVNSFSEAMNEELSSKGIHVLAACPGQVATGFSLRASHGKYKNWPGGMVMTSELVAKEIWTQIQKRQPVRVINWKYRVLIFLGQYFVPRKLGYWIVKKMLSRRV